MLSRTVLRKMPILLLRSTFTQVSKFPLSFRYSLSKKEQNEATLMPRGQMRVDPDLSIPSIHKAIKAENNIEAQIELFKKCYVIMKNKKPKYDAESFDGCRLITKAIIYSKLSETSFENIEVASYVYLYFVKEEILKNDPKIQISIYESFLKKVQTISFNQENWTIISKCYKLCSQFHILNPIIHIKIPFVIINSLKKPWKYNVEILLNVLNGLGSRETHFKDERTAMVLIIAYLYNTYKSFNGAIKMRVVKELIDLQIQNHFGFIIKNEEKILNYFLEDVQAKAFDICSQSLIDLLGKRTKSKSMKQVLRIVVNECFELLNSKGQLKQKLNPREFIKLIVNLSSCGQKYLHLKDLQRAKLMQFFRSHINNKKESKQLTRQLATIINNAYFQNSTHVLQLLMDNSKVQYLNPQLLFALSSHGVSMTKDNDGLSAQISRARQANQKMQMNDLLAFVSIAIQAENNAPSEYYKTLKSQYLGYFRKALLNDPQKLLIELTKLPQTAFYRLHQLNNLQEFVDVFEQKQPHDRYFIRFGYLYLVIELLGVQKALASVWYKHSQRFELVMEMLELMLKNGQSTCHIFPNILVFLNKQIQSYFANNDQSMYYCTISIKHALTYLTLVSKTIQSNSSCKYQDPVYYLYWQLVYTIFRWHDKIFKNVQTQFKYRQFIDILLNNQGYFSKTHQYMELVNRLLALIPKLKPHFETMARIITKGIYLGLVNQQNISRFTSQIKVDYDLDEEVQRIVALWTDGKQQKLVKNQTYPYIKLLDTTRLFPPSQLTTLKQEIWKQDESSLVKALEIYSLPLSPTSAQIYLLLLERLASSDLNTMIGQINLVLIMKNTMKYLRSSQLQCDQGKVCQLMSKVLAIQYSSFNKFTLQYHVDVIQYANKLNIRLRNYERAVLDQLLTIPTPKTTPLIATVTTLAQNQFRFSLKELKMIGQAMLTIKGDWKQASQLLRERLQGLFEGKVKKVQG